MRVFNYFFADFKIPQEGMLERDIDEAVRVLRTFKNLAAVNNSVRRYNVTADTEYFKTIFVEEEGLAVLQGLVRFFIELPSDKKVEELAKTMYGIARQYGFAEPRISLKRVFAPDDEF